MKPGAIVKIAKLLLAAVVVILTASILYKAFQPPTTVESLTQSVNQDASYRKLECALESRDQNDRLAAVQALLALQTDEAFKLLNRAVSDRAIVVRVAIVQRLSNFTEEKALPLILKLLDDKEFGIVRDSIAALQKRTGRDYDFRFEASPEEKASVVGQCKREISERLKR